MDFTRGIIDPGEFPAQALVREVSEETGVIVSPERILGVFGGPEGFLRTYPNGDQVEFVDITFECRAVGGSLDCRDGEAIEARFFSTNELTALPFSSRLTSPLCLGPSMSPSSIGTRSGWHRWPVTSGTDLRRACIPQRPV